MVGGWSFLFSFLLLHQGFEESGIMNFFGVGGMVWGCWSKRMELNCKQPWQRSLENELYPMCSLLVNTLVVVMIKGCEEGCSSFLLPNFRGFVVRLCCLYYCINFCYWTCCLQSCCCSCSCTYLQRLLDKKFVQIMSRTHFFSAVITFSTACFFLHWKRKIDSEPSWLHSYTQLLGLQLPAQNSEAGEYGSRKSAH